ncbi:MAG: ATP-dependent Zn protease [Rhizobium sp.]
MMKTDPFANLAGLRPLALLASGRTGADIERLVKEVRRMLRREGRAMAWNDLEVALRQGHTLMSEELSWRASVHEAGHALVYTLTGVAEVETASVGQHGIGMVATVANGHLPETEAWLQVSIAAILAGRVAERLVVGDVLAGAGGGPESDLARATDMALAAETRLGFSSHQPLLYRSAATASHELAIDSRLAERVNGRLVAAETMATELIERHREVHMTIAKRLNAVGVLAGDELRALILDAVGPDR